MRRLVIVPAVLMAVAVGFAAGWLLLGTDEESSDADRACASAEELPAEFPERSGEGMSADRISLLNRVQATGLLAQSAGQTGAGLQDLDDLGRAGQELAQVLLTGQVDEYDGALAALLEACGDR